MRAAGGLWFAALCALSGVAGAGTSGASAAGADAAPPPAGLDAEAHAATVAWKDAADQHLARVAEVLAVSAQPRDWMLAARLLDARSPAQRALERWDPPAAVPTRAEALVARALAAGVDDPVVTWIAATHCPVAHAVCEPARALARLRELAPDNGAVWAVGVPRQVDAALSDADDAPLRAAERLRRSAAAARYDSYFGERMRHYLDAFARVEPSAELAAVPATHRGALPASGELALAILAFGHGLAEPLVDGSGLARLCGEPARAQLAARGGDVGARRDACLAAATRTVDLADTVLAHRLATATLLRLLPDGPGRQRVLRQQREVAWISSTSNHLLLDASPESAPLSRGWVARWQEPGAAELGVMRAALAELGTADPPLDWVEPGPKPAPASR